LTPDHQPVCQIGRGRDKGGLAIIDFFDLSDDFIFLERNLILLVSIDKKAMELETYIFISLIVSLIQSRRDGNSIHHNRTMPWLACQRPEVVREQAEPEELPE